MRTKPPPPAQRGVCSGSRRAELWPVRRRLPPSQPVAVARVRATGGIGGATDNKRRTGQKEVLPDATAHSPSPEGSVLQKKKMEIGVTNGCHRR